MEEECQRPVHQHPLVIFSFFFFFFLHLDVVETEAQLLNVLKVGDHSGVRLLVAADGQPVLRTRGRKDENRPDMLTLSLVPRCKSPFWRVVRGVARNGGKKKRGQGLAVAEDGERNDYHLASWQSTLPGGGKKKKKEREMGSELNSKDKPRKNAQNKGGSGCQTTGQSSRARSSGPTHRHWAANPRAIHMFTQTSHACKGKKREVQKEKKGEKSMAMAEIEGPCWRTIRASFSRATGHRAGKQTQHCCKTFARASKNHRSNALSLS
jgi:hypothetical protein